MATRLPGPKQQFFLSSLSYIRWPTTGLGMSPRLGVATFEPCATLTTSKYELLEHLLYGLQTPFATSARHRLNMRYYKNIKPCTKIHDLDK